MSRGWRKRIENGEKPSKLIRELLEEHPNIENMEIQDSFRDDYFDELGDESVIVFLWEWNRTLNPNNPGISDERLDWYILDLLGYDPGEYPSVSDGTA